MPATLVLPLLVGKQWWRSVKNDKLLFLLALLFMANFALYWVSIEARSRYIYPLFPLAIMLLMQGFTRVELKPWHQRYLRILSYVLLAIATLGGPALLFIPAFELLDYRLWVAVCLFVLSVGLWLFMLKTKLRPYLVIIGVLVVMRLGFSMTVPVTRAENTGAAEDRSLGYEIAQITDGQPLWRYGDVRMSLTIVFYLEAAREEVLKQRDSFDSGYYFCYSEDLPQSDYELVREFHYHQRPIFLIKVE